MDKFNEKINILLLAISVALLGIASIISNSKIKELALKLETVHDLVHKQKSMLDDMELIMHLSEMSDKTEKGGE